jgi:uncharacterized membrane protein YccC
MLNLLLAEGEKIPTDNLPAFVLWVCGILILTEITAVGALWSQSNNARNDERVDRKEALKTFTDQLDAQRSAHAMETAKIMNDSEKRLDLAFGEFRKGIGELSGQIKEYRCRHPKNQGELG